MASRSAFEQKLLHLCCCSCLEPQEVLPQPEFNKNARTTASSHQQVEDGNNVQIVQPIVLLTRDEYVKHRLLYEEAPPMISRFDDFANANRRSFTAVATLDRVPQTRAEGVFYTRTTPRNAAQQSKGFNRTAATASLPLNRRNQFANLPPIIEVPTTPTYEDMPEAETSFSFTENSRVTTSAGAASSNENNECQSIILQLADDRNINALGQQVELRLGSSFKEENILFVDQSESSHPSYDMLQLATLAAGQQYGLVYPSDGIRRLKQLQQSSAIWPEEMMLHLHDDCVTLQIPENRVVETIPLSLVTEPTGYVSSDTQEPYNNVLIFIVPEDPSRPAGASTEMYLFQCVGTSANEIAEDIKSYKSGHFSTVQCGRRTRRSSSSSLARQPIVNKNDNSRSNQLVKKAAPLPTSIPATATRPLALNGHTPYDQEFAFDRHASMSAFTMQNSQHMSNGDPFGTMSHMGSNDSDIDVKVFNKCLDEIEMFMNRLRQASDAQQKIREMIAEQQAAKKKGRKKGKSGGRRDSYDSSVSEQPSPELLAQARLPNEKEFEDILRKFKLSLNLMAKLRGRINEPNAESLLHFLIGPLVGVAEASRSVFEPTFPQRIASPLLTMTAKSFMLTELNPDERNMWMSLGNVWTTTEEEWIGIKPARFYPRFYDGSQPYGSGESTAPYQPTAFIAPAPQTPAFVVDRTQDILADQLRHIEEERRKVEEEKERLREERDKFNQDRRREGDSLKPTAAPRRTMPPLARGSSTTDLHENDWIERERLRRFENGRRSASPGQRRDFEVVSELQSPRQRVFLESLHMRGAKAVRTTYDRIGQNPKELSVAKGEFLEALNDTKNWWECRNSLGRIGYIPRTILVTVSPFQKGAPFGTGVLANERAAIAQEQFYGGVSGYAPPPPAQPYDRPPSRSIPYDVPYDVQSSQAYDYQGAEYDTGFPAPSRPSRPWESPSGMRSRQGKRGEFRYF